MPERISEDMPHRMPDCMSEEMPERRSEDVPERMSEDMPEWWEVRLRGAVTVGSAKHAGVNAPCRW